MDLVPEEAIEKAAVAQRSPSHKPGPPDPDLLAIWKRTARITLEAAAPLILAAAYERLAEQLPRELGVDDAGDVQRALRGMASVLRGEGDPK